LHPFFKSPGDAGDGDGRKLPGHAVLDLRINFGQDALDVQPARAFGVGLAAAEGEHRVLRLDGAEDIGPEDVRPLSRAAFDHHLEPRNSLFLDTVSRPDFLKTRMSPFPPFYSFFLALFLACPLFLAGTPGDPVGWAPPTDQ